MPYSDLGPGDWCGYSSTLAANSAASSEVASRKADAAASAKCGQMVCNDFVESTKYKSCPSNCTAPSGYAYWIAGGNSGAWCECNGDKSALTAAAQASADALAQQKADAQECDCPEETKYGGIVIELPTGYGCIFDGTGTFSGISVGVSGCGGSVIGRNDRVPVGNYGSISGRGCTGSTLENCNPNGTWTAYVGSITEGVSKRIEASIQS